MRNCRKNELEMMYALYDGERMAYGKDGLPTLEHVVDYTLPVKFRANLSAGNSDANEQPFGANVQYDRIILTHDLSLPVDEHSIIWVKNEPEFNDDGTVNPDSADYEVAAAPVDSLNVLRIAVKRRVQ